MMSSSDSSIIVGAAKRVINPAPSLPLVGYPPRRDNTGVGLDLCVRVMLFGEIGADCPSAGLVVLDSLGADANMVLSIRERIAQAVDGLDASAIMVAATHTHSAPALRTYGRKDHVFEPDPQYVELVIAASAGAAEDAWDARSETKMKVGAASAELGHNRRVVDERTGKATNVWTDEKGEHTGFFWPGVPFVSFECDDGIPVAMLVSYGCHPVTLGPGNTLASPDYPGYFVRKMEADSGAATVLHVTGGGADINPEFCLFDEPGETKRMGEVLASAVGDKLPEALPCRACPIATASVPLGLLISDTARENFFSGRAVDTVDGKVLVTEVQAIRLGELVLISAPGELFAEIAAEMREISPFPQTIVVSYANDYLGYLFTDKAREEGGYEPENPISENIEQPLLAAAKRAMEAVKGE